MTLLVSILNTEFAILLADRRLTSGGNLVDDHYNKLTVLCCHNARVAIAFTGLAQAGTFDTSEWMMSYLNKVGDVDDRFDAIFDGMRIEIESELKRRSLTQHVLTILVSGFEHKEEGLRAHLPQDH